MNFCAIDFGHTNYKLALIKDNNIISVQKNSYENISKVIIGNGTTSRQNIEKLDFIKNDLIIVEEKNTTLRAKKRYFELFPIRGLKTLLPKEIFIMNKNLDALSALLILEDYCNYKFSLSENIDIKTWLK